MDLVGNDHLDYLTALHDTGSASVATGIHYHAKIDLFKGDITPTRDTLLSVYTAAKADYTGYGSDTVTWNAPSRADDGSIEVVGTMPEFRPSDAVAPNIIYGFWETLAGDGSLGFAARFDGAPLPMEDALDAIVLTLRYRPKETGMGSVVS
jgi:hypothetical protein